MECLHGRVEWKRTERSGRVLGQEGWVEVRSNGNAEKLEPSLQREQVEGAEDVVSQVCGHCDNFNSDSEWDSGMIQFV